ncbi:MAG: UDP-3-O-(3-hydroxymyristoyl)glucosamine N-acyltransferase [Alphaproteobacteria bacterium]|nr:UDP-3-O-(3-hydroxymyristoyl)glucosamine N-acyltransferase [Alphaproteobacteria bacterium]
MVDKSFYQCKEGVTLAQVAEVTGSRLENSSAGGEQIAHIATMQSATAEDICFFYDRKSKEKAAAIKAKACVTTEDLKQFVPAGVILLLADNPKEAFLRLNEFMYAEKPVERTIDASAKIASSAKIGQNCAIGAYAVIGENVVIGDNCVIEPHAVIAHDCQIGSDCRIGSGAMIAYSHIGHHCYIYSGARIGQDGFGFQTIGGQHHRIPQLGRVIIGNYVEVGANSCIDRGALDDTIIGDGSKIDNLVQIAHNDRLGRGCVIVAQVGIAGSCNLGDYVVLGGQVGLADHLNVGSGAQVAAQSGVMRDIEPGTVMMGSPCVPFKDFMRQVSFLQRNSKK